MHETDGGIVPVQPPEFFDRIRGEFERLRREGDREWLLFSSAGAHFFCDTQARRASVSQLLIQAVVGTGEAASEDPEAQALEGFRRFLTDSGSPYFHRTLRSSYDGTVDPPVQSEFEEWKVTDLCLAAADYCEYLKTQALIASARRGRRTPRRVGEAATSHPRRRVKAPITAELKATRKSFVDVWLETNDARMPALARACGIDESALRAILREDRSRFGSPKKRRLLRVLGVSEAQWDGTPPEAR